MYISQSLYGAGVKDGPFSGIEFDEYVNWVSDFVIYFWGQLDFSAVNNSKKHPIRMSVYLKRPIVSC